MSHWRDRLADFFVVAGHDLSRPPPGAAASSLVSGQSSNASRGGMAGSAPVASSGVATPSSGSVVEESTRMSGELDTSGASGVAAAAATTTTAATATAGLTRRERRAEKKRAKAERKEAEAARKREAKRRRERLSEVGTTCTSDTESLATTACEEEEDTGGFYFPDDPCIVSQFPPDGRPDMQVPESVPMFCFPNGFGLSKHQDLPQFYAIVLTGQDGQRMYGACLTFFEPMPRLNAKQRRAALRLVRRQRGGTDGAFSLSNSLFYPKAICIISHWPFYSLFKAFLTQLYRLSATETHVPIERYVSHFLHHIPLPPPGKIKVAFHMGDMRLACARPPVNQLPLADVPMQFLFQCLSHDNIITLFEAVLLERRILLHSRHYVLLNIVAEGMTSLIFPFVWAHTYVPLLPDDLIDFCNAPTPFILGAHSRVISSQSVPYDDIVVVDLDANQIHVPPSCAMPPLPESPLNKIIKQLARYASIYQPHHPDLDLLDLPFVNLPNAHQHSLGVNPFKSARSRHSSLKVQETFTVVADQNEAERFPDSDASGDGGGDGAAAGKQPSLASTLHGGPVGRPPVAPTAAAKSAPAGGDRKTPELRQAADAQSAAGAGAAAADGASAGDPLGPQTFVPLQQVTSSSSSRRRRSSKSGASSGKPPKPPRPSSRSSSRKRSSRRTGGGAGGGAAGGGDGRSAAELDDDDEMRRFDLPEVKSAFLRFFAYILVDYHEYILPDADPESPEGIDTAFDQLRFIADAQPHSRPFFSELLQCAAFEQFIMKRLDSRSTDFEILFFEECIQAKINRSKFTRHKRTTPFLDDESFGISQTYECPPVSTQGLEPGKTYRYDEFPNLSAGLCVQTSSKTVEPLVSSVSNDLRPYANVLKDFGNVLKHSSGKKRRGKVYEAYLERLATYRAATSPAKGALPSLASDAPASPGVLRMGSPVPGADSRVNSPQHVLSTTDEEPTGRRTDEDEDEDESDGDASGGAASQRAASPWEMHGPRAASPLMRADADGSGDSAPATPEQERAAIVLQRAWRQGTDQSTDAAERARDEEQSASDVATLITVRPFQMTPGEGGSTPRGGHHRRRSSSHAQNLQMGERPMPPTPHAAPEPPRTHLRRISEIVLETPEYSPFTRRHVRAAVRIQRFVRKIQQRRASRRSASDARLYNAVLRVQAIARWRRARRKLGLFRSTIVRLQSFARDVHARRSAAAVVIQAQARVVVARAAVARRRAHIVLLQSVARRWLTLRHVRSVLMPSVSHVIMVLLLQLWAASKTSVLRRASFTATHFRPEWSHFGAIRRECDAVNDRQVQGSAGSDGDGYGDGESTPEGDVAVLERAFVRLDAVGRFAVVALLTDELGPDLGPEDDAAAKTVINDVLFASPNDLGRSVRDAHIVSCLAPLGRLPEAASEELRRGMAARFVPRLLAAIGTMDASLQTTCPALHIALERIRVERELYVVVLVQRAVRRFLARRRYVRIRSAVVCVQSLFRGRVLRLRYRRKVRAALVLQTWFRGLLARNILNVHLSAVLATHVSLVARQWEDLVIPFKHRAFFAASAARKPPLLTLSAFHKESERMSHLTTSRSAAERRKDRDEVKAEQKLVRKNVKRCERDQLVEWYRAFDIELSGSRRKNKLVDKLMHAMTAGDTTMLQAAPVLKTIIQMDDET